VIRPNRIRLAAARQWEKQANLGAVDFHISCSGRLHSPPRLKGLRMDTAARILFDPAAFLVKVGLSRRVVKLQPKEGLFSQGDPADSVFYLQKGHAKVTVVSTVGKEATITLLAPRDFVGDQPRRDGPRDA
jgi:CRP-like cAMP-binding protein